MIKFVAVSTVLLLGVIIGSLSNVGFGLLFWLIFIPLTYAMLDEKDTTEERDVR